MGTNNKITKIALILYTSGLQYDDRIRKEIESIEKNLPNVKFEIFAILPENKEEKGITDYGVPYYIPFLKSRDKYNSATHKIKKAIDFYKSIRKKLKSFDIIWIADEHPFLFPLLMSGKKFIWDLHEIPTLFIGNPFKKILFQIIEKKCNYIFHANNYRIEYLKNNKLLKSPEKHVALRNFPDAIKDRSQLKDEKFIKFKNWVNGRNCIYIQGVNNEGRKCYQTLSAVLNNSQLCAVVVGNVDKNSLKKIYNEYNHNNIESQLFFTGQIPQRETGSYMAECVMSLIFYSTDVPNNKYCEPNRMFQSIQFGLPVVVGNNPPMKELVEQYCLGIALDDDGSDINLISSAVNEILTNYEKYKMNVLANKEIFTWLSQEKFLISSIKNTINS